MLCYGVSPCYGVILYYGVILCFVVILCYGVSFCYGFLSVQNSSIGDLVTQSVSQSLRVLLLLTNKERPLKRHVTFETFDQSDEKA